MISLKGKYMFKNNFVMAIKANGKILREFDNITYLPFGSEYSIILKNLSDKRAKVKITIDGNDVIGSHLILDKKSDIEVKRFIKNGNLETGNSFKFIEKTEKIEKYRGNKIDDGIISVEVEFEKENCIQPKPYSPYREDPKPWEPTNPWEDRRWRGDVWYSYYTKEFPISDKTMCSDSNTKNYSRGILRSASANIEGITAPGSINDQKFISVPDINGDGKKFTLSLQLKGEIKNGETINKVVSVKKLIRCSICGTYVKQIAKFCHECGASVEVV